MSTDTDRLGERVANIEGRLETLDQIDTRLGTVEDRLETLDGKIDDAKRDVRRWLVLVVLATTLLTSIVFGLLQVVL
jgi:hypothetical protein